MKDHFTLVVPWANTKDWTGLFVEYFTKLLAPYAEVSLIQGPPAQAGRLGWLVPKLDISGLLLDAASEGRIGNKIFLLDPNYVNIRALRAMTGGGTKIFTLVNGGAFQDYDIETQALPEYRDAMKSYESGFYSLCDRIIAPSLYAQKIFLEAYPSLASKTLSIPFPLRTFPDLRKDFISKSGLISVGRTCFEKGSDILAKCDDVRKNELKEPDEYLEDVSKALAVVIPARAELFGYCAMEALQCGTLPIVPKGLFYLELNLPDHVRLSHPVGEGTAQEIGRIWKRVCAMDRQIYETIVNDARDSLFERFSNQDSCFLELLCN